MMKTFARWLTTLPILSVALLNSSVQPGKYRRLSDLDYFSLNFSHDGAPEILYHHYKLTNVSFKLSDDGELTHFRFPAPRNHPLDGRQQILESSFRVLNASYLEEIQGVKKYLWKYLPNHESRNNLVEVAFLEKYPSRDRKFIENAFSPQTRPPVYFWEGVYGISSCPTTPLKYIDKTHSASKIMGITMAHFRIWQEFYRRFRYDDQSRRLLILEGGVRCARSFCRDLAMEYINSVSEDILFLGWCYMSAEVGFEDPPVCAHAYSISVKAAKILLNHIFPCISPIDGQIANLCKEGKLTWERVTAQGNRIRRGKTMGLIRQEDWR